MYSGYNIECLPDASGTSLPSPPAQERGLKQFETFLSQSSLQDMADRHESNNERLDNAPEDSNFFTPPTRTGPLSTHSNTNPSGSSAISSNTTDSMWQEYQEREPKFVPPSTQACQRYRQSFHFHTNSALIHPTMELTSMEFALRTAMFALGALHLLEYKSARALFSASKSAALHTWTTESPERHV